MRITGEIHQVGGGQLTAPEDAADRFLEILDLYVDDSLSSFFLKRCQKHLDKPYLSDLKGAHVLETKE